MFFDMGKNTKSNPASKGDRVKKIFFPVYQINTDVSLTAILGEGGRGIEVERLKINLPNPLRQEGIPL
jgi:hypothetical protein